MKNNYEFIAILDLEKATAQGIGAITKTLKKYNVEIKEIDKWGDKLLAYPITKNNKKHNRGFYIRYDFKADQAIIADLDATISKNNNIIKYIIVKNEDIFD